jgi:PEP-CTERM motif
MNIKEIGKIARTEFFRRFAMIAVLGYAGATAMPGTASAITIAGNQTVNWANAFVLQDVTTSATGGPVENPLVLVGFNPQPEPPAGPDTVLNNSTPNMPELGLTGVNNPQTFRLLFAIGAPTGKFAISSSTDATANGLSLTVTGPNGSYMIDFGFRTSSMGGISDPGSLVGFNPQPEPPAGPADSAVFGMDFQFTSLSDAFVSLQVTGPGGNSLTFRQVPEPAALAIFLVGLAGLGLMKRGQSRPAP